MAALLFVAFLAMLSVLVVTGHSADTRDPDYALGKLLTFRSAPHPGD